MKTAISISDEIFEAAEDLTRRLDVSRSELFARAMESFIKRHRNQGVTDQINKVYQTEKSSLDSLLEDLQHHSLSLEKW